jgi:hypothetical protein
MQKESKSNNLSLAEKITMTCDLHKNTTAEYVKANDQDGAKDLEDLTKVSLNPKVLKFGMFKADLSAKKLMEIK